MKEVTRKLINETGKPKTKPSSIKVVTTVDDLKAQFDIARIAENWKDVSKLAREINLAEKAQVQDKKEALIKQTSFLRDCFRQAIETAITEVTDNLSEEEMTLVEGVWMSRDFGNGDFNVTIVKDRMPNTRTKNPRLA